MWKRASTNLETNSISCPWTFKVEFHEKRWCYKTQNGTFVSWGGLLEKNILFAEITCWQWRRLTSFAFEDCISSSIDLPLKYATKTSHIPMKESNVMKEALAKSWHNRVKWMHPIPRFDDPSFIKVHSLGSKAYQCHLNLSSPLHTQLNSPKRKMKLANFAINRVDKHQFMQYYFDLTPVVINVQDKRHKKRHTFQWKSPIWWKKL